MSGISLNFTFSEKLVGQKFSQKKYLKALRLLGIILILPKFIAYFYKITPLQFYLTTMVFHSLSFLYILFSRYLLFVTIVTHYTLPSMIKFDIIVIIFIGLVSTMLRQIINIAILVITAIAMQNLTVQSSFYVTEGIPSDPYTHRETQPKPIINGWFNKVNYTTPSRVTRKPFTSMEKGNSPVSQLKIILSNRRKT